MVNQKQVFPIWKYLLLNIITYAREDYLLSDRFSCSIFSASNIRHADWM